MSFANIDVIIPAYQPVANVLIPLVKELLSLEFHHIVVVDDGSDSDKKSVFEQLATLSNVTIIHLPKNMGKGAALKTGMRWVLENNPATIGVVTVDADGQHIPGDIMKVATALQNQPDKLFLGVRAFDTNVPWRSRFGNTLTRTLFYWKYKTKILDTQTGLRAIPKEMMKKFLKIPAKRYEYEMACLIHTVKNHYPMEQIVTETVYIDRNISSHFNPIIDSIRIYYTFFFRSNQ